MYRRNIHSLLATLAMGLAGFVTYQALLKPISPVPHSPVPPPIEQETPPRPLIPQHTPVVSTPNDPSADRALDPSAIPASEITQLLASIRGELEDNHLQAAEQKLTGVPSSALNDPKVASYVALLWNNLGLAQEQEDGTKAAVKAFQKAAALDGGNPVIHLNLAHAYWELRDPALNEAFLTRLLNLAPQNPFPHVALAELLYDQDHLADAATHLAQATERAGKDPRVQSYLAAVTAKVRHTDTVESRMAARNSLHFLVKFDGGEDPDTWTTALEILEEAYREIGQRLNYFPTKPITVVLHTAATFQSATGSPAWADGLYDPVLGRIHIPTRGATTDTAWLTHVLRHEYVHALLHDRLEGHITALPVWLNEGLAMQLAGDPWPDLDQAMPQGGSVLHLKSLEGGWGRFQEPVARLAYLEANSATHYLIERYGMNQIGELLTAFKTKAPVETVLHNQLFLSYDQFHQQWLDTFLHKRT